MERRVVVLPRGAQPEEVLGGARNQVAVDLEVERAETGHELDVALLFETADEVVATTLDLLVGSEVVFALHLEKKREERGENGDRGGSEGGGVRVGGLERARTRCFELGFLSELFFLFFLGFGANLCVTKNKKRWDLVDEALHARIEGNARVLSLLLQLVFLLDVEKLGNLTMVRLGRVLKNNDVIFREGLTGDQVFPAILINIEFFDTVVEIHIARRSNNRNF